MTLTTTGAIPGFGRVSLPTPPRRISSKRWEVQLRAHLATSGGRLAVVEACEEHRSVVIDSVNMSGSDCNWSYTFQVDTARVYNPRQLSYQVVDDLLRNIMRKARALEPTPDAKPATIKRNNRYFARH